MKIFYLFAFYRTLFDHSNVLLPTFNMHIKLNLSAEIFKIGRTFVEYLSFHYEIHIESFINMYNLEKNSIFDYLDGKIFLMNILEYVNNFFWLLKQMQRKPWHHSVVWKLQYMQMSKHLQNLNACKFWHIWPVIIPKPNELFISMHIFSTSEIFLQYKLRIFMTLCIEYVIIWNHYFYKKTGRWVINLW